MCIVCDIKKAGASPEVIALVEKLAEATDKILRVVEKANLTVDEKKKIVAICDEMGMTQAQQASEEAETIAFLRDLFGPDANITVLSVAPEERQEEYTGRKLDVSATLKRVKELYGEVQKDLTGEDKIPTPDNKTKH